MPLCSRKLPPVSTTIASVAAGCVSAIGGVANHNSPPSHDTQQAAAATASVRKARRSSVIAGLQGA